MTETAPKAKDVSGQETQLTAEGYSRVGARHATERSVCQVVGTHRGNPQVRKRKGVWDGISKRDSGVSVRDAIELNIL
jgi:uncharacterized protein (DUF2342 family)